MISGIARYATTCELGSRRWLVPEMVTLNTDRFQQQIANFW
jgi:hypothetical protein